MVMSCSLALTSTATRVRLHVNPPLSLPSLTTLTAAESFVARTYVFESQISRPFCPGFTVPDPESEEEDIAERRGSLTDPFVIRSSSPSSGQSAEDEQAEVTLIMDQVLSQEEPTKLYIPAPHTSSDAEADGGLESDFDSEAGSVDYPEMESDSEAEIQDSDDEALEQDCPAHMTEPASTTVPTFSSHRYVYSSDDAPAQEYLPRVDAYNSDGTTQPQECLPQVGLLGPQRYVNHPMPSMNASSLGNVSSNDDAAPPLPPRPTVRPAHWNDSFPIFGHQTVCTAFNFDNYMGTFGDRPSLFTPESPAAPEFMHSRTTMANFCGYPAGQMFQADRLPSPPPMPTSDVESTVPLQPGRRTKVSIEEIVEEQPRTPESVSSLKRKADVLEHEEPIAISDEVFEEAAVATEKASADATVAVPIHNAATTQAAAAIAQRPKKIPRSILNRVLNKAAYPLLGATGAVVSFALLSTLPDTFFV